MLVLAWSIDNPLHIDYVYLLGISLIGYVHVTKFHFHGDS